MILEVGEDSLEILDSFRYLGCAWLAELVISLLSDHKVPSSIPALLRFEYLYNLLYRLI